MSNIDNTLFQLVVKLKTKMLFPDNELAIDVRRDFVLEDAKKKRITGST